MFGLSVIESAKMHALDRFPEESCGLVVDGAYIACDNIAEDPTKDFKIANATVQEYLAMGLLQGVIHSHPFAQLTTKSSPSAADMRSQMSMQVPFGVIDTDGTVVNDPYYWGDFKLDEQIIGRDFHHGIEDCYLPIRRFYWQRRGIKLAEIPRDDKWWTSADNLYVDNFERLGFVKVSKNEIIDGDIIIGRVNASKPNHAGVYLNNSIDGKGLILHHLPGRLSRREPAGPWLSRADLVVRYYAK